MDHDVIVVGTRAAGAATAMLLARAGLRVLAVDRARFPSDTLSTHQVQVPGIAPPPDRKSTRLNSSHSH